MAMHESADPLELEKLKKEIDALKRHLHIVSHQRMPLPLTVTPFSLDSQNVQLSEPFYSHPCGYKLCLQTEVGGGSRDDPSFAIHVCLMHGEFDQELEWPVKARVTVQIQNQNGDSNHIRRSKQISWQYKSVCDPLPIPVMTDVDVASLKGCDSEEGVVRYVVRDTLQLEVRYMALES